MKNIKWTNIIMENLIIIWKSQFYLWENGGALAEGTRDFLKGYWKSWYEEYWVIEEASNSEGDVEGNGSVNIFDVRPLTSNN